MFNRASERIAFRPEEKALLFESRRNKCFRPACLAGVRHGPCPLAAVHSWGWWDQRRKFRDRVRNVNGYDAEDEVLADVAVLVGEDVTLGDDLLPGDFGWAFWKASETLRAASPMISILRSVASRSVLSAMYWSKVSPARESMTSLA